MLNIPKLINYSMNEMLLLHASKFNLLVDNINKIIDIYYHDYNINTDEFKKSILKYFKHINYISEMRRIGTGEVAIDIDINMTNKHLIKVLIINNINKSDPVYNDMFLCINSIDNPVKTYNNNYVYIREFPKYYIGYIMLINNEYVLVNPPFSNFKEGINTTNIKTISNITKLPNVLDKNTLYIVDKNDKLNYVYENKIVDYEDEKIKEIFSSKFIIMIKSTTPDIVYSSFRVYYSLGDEYVNLAANVDFEKYKYGDKVYYYTNHDVVKIHIETNGVMDLKETHFIRAYKSLINMDNLVMKSGSYVYFYPEWDTSNVYTMNRTIADNGNITHIYGLNLLDYSNVKYMDYFIYNCVNLKYIDKLHINTPKVESMKFFISYCTNLDNIDLSYLSIRNVKNLYGAFSNNGYNFPIKIKWPYQFYLDNIENLTAFMSKTSVYKLPDTSKWNTSKVKTFNYFMAKSRYYDGSIDTSNWDTSSVEDFSYFLYWCKSLLTPPDTSNWDTSNVTNFKYFLSTTNIDIAPDTSNWNTSNVTNFSYFLDHCQKMTTIPDTSNWNTSNVTDFSYFMSNTKVTEFIDTSAFDVSNVKSFRKFYYNTYTFNGTIDLSNWDTSNVTDFNGFFEGTNIKDIKGIENLNVSKVIDLGSFLAGTPFRNGGYLDLGNWDTSNVENLKYFLYDVKIKTLILNIDMSKVTDISYCLYHCTNLECVSYLDTRNVNNKTYLLSNCPNLQHPTDVELDDLKDDNGALYIYDGCTV